MAFSFVFSEIHTGIKDVRESHTVKVNILTTYHELRNISRRSKAMTVPYIPVPVRCNVKRVLIVFTLRSAVYFVFVSGMREQ